MITRLFFNVSSSAMCYHCEMSVCSAHTIGLWRTSRFKKRDCGLYRRVTNSSHTLMTLVCVPWVREVRARSLVSFAAVLSLRMETLGLDAPRMARGSEDAPVMRVASCDVRREDERRGHNGLLAMRKKEEKK